MHYRQLISDTGTNGTTMIHDAQYCWLLDSIRRQCQKRVWRKFRFLKKTAFGMSASDGSSSRVFAVAVSKNEYRRIFCIRVFELCFFYKMF
jgi:hypothetical protein